jgi:hypothetical protein
MLPEGDEDWQSIDLRKFVLYGGAATLAIDVLMYPLELVKTKMQVDVKVSLLTSCALVDASFVCV